MSIKCIVWSMSKTTTIHRFRITLEHLDSMNNTIDDRPFTVRRVARPGSSINTAPMVVSCEWSELKTENVYQYTCKTEDLLSVTGCNMHKGCKGHHMKDQNDTAWLIPFGFATGDELRYSEAATINSGVCTGGKTADDVMNFCYDRIRGKKGDLAQAVQLD